MGKGKEKKSLNEFQHKVRNNARLRGPKAPRNLICVYHFLGMTPLHASDWLLAPAQWDHHRAMLTCLILAD